MAKNKLNQLLIWFCTAVMVTACAQPTETTEDVAQVETPAEGFKISPPAPAASPSLENYIALSEEDTSSEQWETIFGGQLVVRNTTSAGLYAFKPAPSKSNGRAVIILPGGGYHFVSMANEGFPVAERLAAEGYTAFVLKYRVRPAPRDGQGFLDAMAPTFMTLGKSRLPSYDPATEDFRTAMEYLAVECKFLGCDGSKISAIGFSAGSRTIMDGFKNTKPATELESVGLIYPPMIDTFDTETSAPLFVGISVDDPLFEQGEFTLLSDWLARSKDLEFHLYSGGRHGFGMSKSGTTSEKWIDQYVDWLSVHVGSQEPVSGG